MRMFLVTGEAFEYDDENYCSTSGVVNDNLFASRQDAEERVLTLAAQDLLGFERLGDYLGCEASWEMLTPVEQEPELYAKVLSYVGNVDEMPYHRDDEGLCTYHEDTNPLSEEQIVEAWLDWALPTNIDLTEAKELVPLFKLNFWDVTELEVQ